jgi:hypothetical protein
MQKIEGETSGFCIECEHFVQVRCLTEKWRISPMKQMGILMGFYIDKKQLVGV